MALWREAAKDEGYSFADAVVAEFRKRYPPEPQTPEAVWYDEPPFAKDGKGYHCWVETIDSPQAVYWSDLHSEWRFFEGVSNTQSLNRRRVCPIVKPPEPTT